LRLKEADQLRRPPPETQAAIILTRARLYVNAVR